jgi:hypothetical protein
MTRLMANYVGPIAAILVKRESRAVENPHQLREQLASHIPDQDQRAQFLQKAQSLGRDASPVPSRQGAQ